MDNNYQIYQEDGSSQEFDEQNEIPNELMTHTEANLPDLPMVSSSEKIDSIKNLNFKYR